MNTQQQWLLNTLLEFYQNTDYLETLKQMINREYTVKNQKKLSIRMVNWFVTNYAKQYFTVYEAPTQEEGKQGRRFFVWTNYKSTEDSYSKQLFDPYCRKERILIPYKEEQRIETTIAQMHFFKWAILNGVLEYIAKHYDDIEKDMSKRLNNSRKKTDANPITINNNTNITNNNTNTLNNTNTPSSSNAISSTVFTNITPALGTKTRKKREELSTNACRSIRKEFIPVAISLK
jgi:hypothetical protein